MTAPNIVLIVTDDQPKGLIDATPNIASRIRDLGRNFPCGVITTPLCGPSRSSIFSGRYAHNHGVWSNQTANDILTGIEDELLPVHLHDAGYYTALSGKYMNGWNKTRVVPPGWDRFMSIVPDDGGDGAYYNYSMIGTQGTIHYGTTETDYSTDVVTDWALSHIQAAPAGQPLFLAYTPFGAHAAFRPAPRWENSWPVEPVGPCVNSDNSFRAPWLHDLPPVDTVKVQNNIRDQHETVRAVDDGVVQIMDLMEAAGRSDTLYIVTGDNGLQHGNERLMGKNVPYQGSLNVQMMMRWDGHIPANTRDLQPVRNEDITATICAAASATMPNLDGADALGPADRSGGVLVEGGAGDGGQPAWIGWRTKRYLYINWGISQGEELYDYDTDPNELTNLNSGSFPSARVLNMRGKAMAAAAGRYPPGFIPYGV